MFKKIKAQIESKRNSKNIFWRFAVLIKDIVWVITTRRIKKGESIKSNVSMINPVKVAARARMKSISRMKATSVSAKKLRFINLGELLTDWNWTNYDSLITKVKSVNASIDINYPNYGKADCIFGNLEFCIEKYSHTISGNKYDDNRIFHCARSDVLDALQAELGVNMVSPCNNHVFDCKAEGIKQTIEALDDSGIVYSGIGLNKAQAKSPGIMTLDDGTKVAVLCGSRNSSQRGAAAGNNSPGIWYGLDDSKGDYSKAAMIKAIKNVPSDVDYIIVYAHYHWKQWYDDGYFESKKDFAFWDFFMDCADAGAHVVIADGPHQPCGWDVYNGSVLLFSNGNLFNNTRKSLGSYNWKSWVSYITDILFVGDSVGAIKFIPCETNEIGVDGKPYMKGGNNKSQQSWLHFKSRGVPKVSKGDNAVNTLEHVNDLCSENKLERFQIKGGVAYWPSKEVWDSLAFGKK